MDDKLKDFLILFFRTNLATDIYYDNRFDNRLCHALMLAILTGEPPVVNFGSHNDMIAVSRLYAFLPDQYKPQADMVINHWKKALYKDPDPKIDILDQIDHEIEELVNGYM